MQALRRFPRWWREFRSDLLSDGGVHFFGTLVVISVVALLVVVLRADVAPIPEPSTTPAAVQR